MLAARGVTIANGATDPGRAAPASAHEIASVASPPLDQIVGQMLTISNNETAELLTRELGVERADGTTAAGTRVIPEVLRRLGVPTAGVALVDGSGLAPADRVTCAALMGVVALGSQSTFAGIINGLPVAGQSGTLAERFLGTLARRPVTRQDRPHHRRGRPRRRDPPGPRQRRELPLRVGRERQLFDLRR